jgi:hypothetical protein
MINSIDDKFFNERRQGKIQQLGYDEIVTSAARTDSCNYCLQRNEVEAILASIEPLNWTTRWYSSSDDDIDRNLIEAFTAGIRRKLMSDCCPDEDRLLRINDDGTIEQSNDGGDTWIEAGSVDDPRKQTPLYPPLPGDDDDEKKCAAANNTLAYFQQIYTEMADKQTEGATLLEIIGAAIAVFLIIISAPAIAFLGPFLLEVAAEIFTITGAVWKSAIQACDDAVFCLFFCHVQSDASYSDDDVEALLIDVAASGMDEKCIVFYTKMIKVLQSKGMTNAARTALGGTRSCDDCHCGEWCLTVDLTDNDGGLTVDPRYGYGTYVSSTGWQTTDLGGGNASATLLLDITVSGLTRVIVGVAGGGNLAVQSYDLMTNYIYAIPFTTNPVDSGPITGSFTGPMFFNPSSDTAHGSSVTLTSIEIRGTGTPPTLTGWTAC